MSRRRDLLRRAGLNPGRGKKSRGYTRFLSKTIENYAWPLRKNFIMRSGVSGIFDCLEGKTREMDAQEAMVQIESWARRESLPF